MRPFKVTGRSRSRLRRSGPGLAGQMWPVACVVLLLALVACGSRPPEPPESEEWASAPAGASGHLRARVTFDAMRLGIENRGADAWTNVLVELRRDGSSPVYRYRTDVVTAGRTLPMGALNFEADDGRRLSPFEGAPTAWRIQATLPDGTRAWASGRIVEVAPD